MSELSTISFWGKRRMGYSRSISKLRPELYTFFGWGGGVPLCPPLMTIVFVGYTNNASTVSRYSPFRRNCALRNATNCQRERGEVFTHQSMFWNLCILFVCLCSCFQAFSRTPLANSANRGLLLFSFRRCLSHINNCCQISCVSESQTSI